MPRYTVFMFCFNHLWYIYLQVLYKLTIHVGKIYHFSWIPLKNSLLVSIGFWMLWISQKPKKLSDSTPVEVVKSSKTLPCWVVFWGIQSPIRTGYQRDSPGFLGKMGFIHHLQKGSWVFFLPAIFLLWESCLEDGLPGLGDAVDNHGDRLSPFRIGQGSPSKWPFHGL